MYAPTPALVASEDAQINVPSPTMTSFLTPNFLLDTAIAQRLYHEVACELPIIDYHSHLQQSEIVAKKQFANLTQLWLGGDHYKWRILRAAGVPEDFITGNQPERAKFDEFCRVLPMAIGSPVYHWCHLELLKIFQIEAVINAASSQKIWEQTTALLANMNTWTFLQHARVEVACTTDDPLDDLALHQQIASSQLRTRVLPAFRPDRAMRINADGFAAYIESLGQTCGHEIGSYPALLQALEARVLYFHARGARISDHAVDVPLGTQAASIADCDRWLKRRRKGLLLTDEEQAAYQRRLLQDLGGIYARQAWTMCLHIGAQRNNNSRGMQVLGPDTGYDAMSDATHTPGIAALLDALERGDELPKTMLFCLNPAMNDAMAVLIGCFQGGGARGKLQFGPAWWFNDHKEGNLRQLRTLANHGVLGSFVGMTTDSRSFASYPRHDYFRRLLCRQIGRWVTDGEYPHDRHALEALVRGVCHDNAEAYFAL